MNIEADTRQQSPRRSGAEMGLPVGIYFAMMFLTYMAGTATPTLTLVFVAMVAAFPFLVYALLRRQLRWAGSDMPVVSLWIQGIVMIAGGALLCSVLILVYFKWIEPDFMVTMMERAATVLTDDPDPSVAELGRMARGLIDNRAVPSASTLTLSFWLFTVSTGSMLAGLMALLAKLKRLPEERKLHD